METPTRAEKKRETRLEDSFSLPENQRHLPEDPYVLPHDAELVEKWRNKECFVENGKAVCRK